MRNNPMIAVFRSLYTSVVFLAVGFILLFATSLFLSPPHGVPPLLLESIVGVTVLYILSCAPLSLVLYWLKGRSVAIVPFVLFAMFLMWVMIFFKGSMPLKDGWYTLVIWNASWITLLFGFVVSSVAVVRNNVNWFILVFLLSIPLILLLMVKVMDYSFLWFLIPVGILFLFNAIIEYTRSQGYHGASGIPVFGGMLAAIGAFMCLPYWWALFAPLFFWFDFAMVMLAVVYLFPKHFPDFHREEQTSLNTQTPESDIIAVSLKEKISFAARALLWITVVLFFIAGSIHNKIESDDRKYKKSVNTLTHEVRQHEQSS